MVPSNLRPASQPPIVPSAFRPFGRRSRGRRILVTALVLDGLAQVRRQGGIHRCPSTRASTWISHTDVGRWCTGPCRGSDHGSRRYPHPSQISGRGTGVETRGRQKDERTPRRVNSPTGLAGLTPQTGELADRLDWRTLRDLDGWMNSSGTGELRCQSVAIPRRCQELVPLLPRSGS
jgi:hypothetical protein